MTFEIFPWKEWISLLINGDAAPFFNGLRRAVYGYSFLRGKSTEDLRREYGDDIREDILQTVAIKLLQVIDRWAGERSDEELAAYIVVMIRNEVSDRYRRSRLEKILFCAADDESPKDHTPYRSSAYNNSPDPRPTPEIEIIQKQFMESVYELLTARQKFILDNYKAFGSGDWGAAAIANAHEVSIKTIEKDVAEIKRKIREFALRSGYLVLVGTKLNHKKTSEMAPPIENKAEPILAVNVTQDRE